MAAMLVPLPETSSSSPTAPLKGTHPLVGHASPASNTLLPGHYPASQDPMTNISRHRLRNALEQNHSIRRSGCDTAPLPRRCMDFRTPEFFDAGHMSEPRRRS
jgi:hypothetical protein